MPIPDRPWHFEPIGGSIIDTDGDIIIDGEDSRNNQYSAELLQHIVAAVNAYPPKPQIPGMCVVCHQVPVCSEEGFDTCKACVNKI